MPTAATSTGSSIASVGRIDADDCYQETWIAALRAYPKLRDASNLRSWIFTVAHRKAIDHVRARRRAPVLAGNVPETADTTRELRETSPTTACGRSCATSPTSSGPRSRCATSPTPATTRSRP